MDDQPTAPADSPLSRPRAAACAVLAPVALLAGAAVYVTGSPLGNTAPLVLSGQARAAGLAEAAGWDLALIAGYGTALALCTVLARSVFHTPAARLLARVLGPLAAVAVVADLGESALVLLADQRPQLQVGTVLSAVAVLKTSTLLPAAVVSAFALVVTVARLLRRRPAAHWPVEPDAVLVPPSGAEPGKPPPEPSTTAGRWRRGYLVPGLTDAEVQRRAAVGGTVGICLSGGGVRSASVALGALQGLRARSGLDLLQRVRYLASVSGGGYTAGALQLALTGASDPERPRTDVVRDATAALQPGSVEEDHVRRHASYLASSPGELVVALGVVARGLVLSLLVLFTPALVLGVVVHEVYDAMPLADLQSGSWAPRPGALWCVAAIVALAAAAYAVTLVLDGFTRRSSEDVRRAAMGLTCFALLVAVLSIGVPALVHAARALLDTGGTAEVAVGGPVVSVVLTYVAVLVSLTGKSKRAQSIRAWLTRTQGLPVAKAPRRALRLLLVVLCLAVLAAAWLLLLGGAAARADEPGAVAVAAVLGVALAVLGGLLDQSSLSLHPFYRRRLARAFAVRRVREGDHAVAEGYPYGERTSLATYGARPTAPVVTSTEPVDAPTAVVDAPIGPEVVFCAAANLTGENRTPTDAVGFTLTGEWIGGPDVGYVRTDALDQAVSPRLQRDLTVQAAVAMSGAAVSSSMGRAGRWYQTLFAVSGVRLGTWLPNPAFVAEAAQRAGDWTAPGLPSLRRLTYLVREVIGSHRCTDRLLQISDGGHYENLGLVELLRRRCTVVCCIDGSGDQPPTAGTLEQALTLAHAELGVTITWHDGRSPWCLVPGSGTPLEPAAALSEVNERLAAGSVATATLTYPAESGLDADHRTGLLVFAKAVLTADLPYDVLSYAARHPVFPRDSTGDQFFDDEQFSAYLALGRHIGAGAAQAWRDVAANDVLARIGAQVAPRDDQPLADAGAQD